MLRLVPVFFLAASACLLVYGFFFKTYDGYHDERSTQSRSSRTEVFPNFLASQSQNASNYGATVRRSLEQERHSLVAQRLPPTTLPTISETAELNHDADPEGLYPPSEAIPDPATLTTAVQRAADAVTEKLAEADLNNTSDGVIVPRESTDTYAKDVSGEDKTRQNSAEVSPTLPVTAAAVGTVVATAAAVVAGDASAPSLLDTPIEADESEIDASMPARDLDVSSTDADLGTAKGAVTEVVYGAEESTGQAIHALQTVFDTSATDTSILQAETTIQVSGDVQRPEESATQAEQEDVSDVTVPDEPAQKEESEPQSAYPVHESETLEPAQEESATLETGASEVDTKPEGEIALEAAPVDAADTKQGLPDFEVGVPEMQSAFQETPFEEERAEEAPFTDAETPEAIPDAKDGAPEIESGSVETPHEEERDDMTPPAEAGTQEEQLNIEVGDSESQSGPVETPYEEKPAAETAPEEAKAEEAQSEIEVAAPEVQSGPEKTVDEDEQAVETVFDEGDKQGEQGNISINAPAIESGPTGTPQEEEHVPETTSDTADGLHEEEIAVEVMVSESHPRSGQESDVGVSSPQDTSASTEAGVEAVDAGSSDANLESTGSTAIPFETSGTFSTTASDGEKRVDISSGENKSLTDIKDDADHAPVEPPLDESTENAASVHADAIDSKANPSSLNPSSVDSPVILEMHSQQTTEESADKVREGVTALDASKPQMLEFEGERTKSADEEDEEKNDENAKFQTAVMPEHEPLDTDIPSAGANAPPADVDTEVHTHNEDDALQEQPVQSTTEGIPVTSDEQEVGNTATSADVATERQPIIEPDIADTAVDEEDFPEKNDVLAALAELHAATENVKAVVESGALSINNTLSSDVQDSGDNELEDNETGREAEIGADISAVDSDTQYLSPVGQSSVDAEVSGDTGALTDSSHVATVSDDITGHDQESSAAEHAGDEEIVGSSLVANDMEKTDLETDVNKTTENSSDGNKTSPTEQAGFESESH